MNFELFTFRITKHWQSIDIANFSFYPDIRLHGSLLYLNRMGKVWEFDFLWVGLVYDLWRLRKE